MKIIAAKMVDKVKKRIVVECDCGHQFEEMVGLCWIICPSCKRRESKDAVYYKWIENKGK